MVYGPVASTRSIDELPADAVARRVLVHHPRVAQAEGDVLGGHLGAVVEDDPFAQGQVHRPIVDPAPFRRQGRAQAVVVREVSADHEIEHVVQGPVRDVPRRAAGGQRVGHRLNGDDDRRPLLGLYGRESGRQPGDDRRHDALLYSR